MPQDKAATSSARADYHSPDNRGSRRLTPFCDLPKEEQERIEREERRLLREEMKRQGRTVGTFVVEVEGYTFRTHYDSFEPFEFDTNTGDFRIVKRRRRRPTP